MDTIKVFSCGGESVVIAGGVNDGEEEKTASEIIKGEPMSVQAGFLKSTGIKIPRLVEAGGLFSADTALCCAEILCESSQNESVSLSSSALETVFKAEYDKESERARLILASRAKINLNGFLPSVVFGGCEYFFLKEVTENPEELLKNLSENSALESDALLVIENDKITPYFLQKGGDCCAFSSGSAAIAAAFFESEENRDYLKKTYSFPKGEREVELKRFLSEAFECRLRAKVVRTG